MHLPAIIHFKFKLSLIPTDKPKVTIDLLRTEVPEFIEDLKEKQQTFLFRCIHILIRRFVFSLIDWNLIVDIILIVLFQVIVITILIYRTWRRDPTLCFRYLMTCYYAVNIQSFPLEDKSSFYYRGLLSICSVSSFIPLLM